MSYSRVSGVTTVLNAVTAITTDPALPTVANLVMELRSLEAKGDTTVSTQPGIGLKRIVTPLRYYVTYRRNPILGYAAVAAILGLPFLLGYKMGKRKRTT